MGACGMVAPVSSRCGIWNTLSALATPVWEPVSACSEGAEGQTTTFWDAARPLIAKRRRHPPARGLCRRGALGRGSKAGAASAAIWEGVTLASRLLRAASEAARAVGDE